MQPAEAIPDFSAIFSRKDRIIESRSHGRERMKQRGIDLFEAEARFIDAHTVDASGTRLVADRFVIATGSRPLIPPVRGLEATGYWTSYDAVYPDRQPESLAIIGGSAIGCEFAQIYSRLGTRVLLMEMQSRLLPGEDDDVSRILADVFEDEGIEVLLGARVEAVSGGAEGKIVQYHDDAGSGRVVAEEILVAAGRVPALEGLSLDAAEVEIADGAIAVDSNLRTSQPHIFACGDATGAPMLSHIATYEGTVAGANSVADGSDELEQVDHRLSPGAIFTDPPVAFVGLSEREAVERGHKLLVGRALFRDTGRAVAMGEKQGMLKLIADAGSREIIGAHIIGAGADMIIHEAVVAMGSRLTIDALKRPRAIHIHPTLSETIAAAAATAR